MAQRVREEDVHPGWSVSGGAASGLKLVAGVDISFVKDSPEDACAMICVLSYPRLELVHVQSAMVKLTAPYISGFLAFREAPHLVDLFEALRQERPDLVPQLIMVDGNGLLHPRALGQYQ